MDDLKKIGEYINKIPVFFQELKGRFENLGKGFENSFAGIGDEFNALGEGLKVGMTDVGLLIEFVFVFVASYVGCGVYFLSQIRHCFFYYWLEIFGQMLYIPIRAIAWVIKFIFKINTFKYLDEFWMYMEKADKVLYKYMGFHMIHYPRSVREKCYVCKRLKQSAVSRQATTTNDDFKPGGRIEEILNSGLGKFREAKNNFESVFA